MASAEQQGQVAELSQQLLQQQLDPETTPTNGHHWDLDKEQLYKLALQFYKEKEGKVIQQSYQTRLRFVALSQQVSHGACREENLPPLGVLDVIGRDRRQAWLALGELSREEAMDQYVQLLTSVCSAFTPYVEAHIRNLHAQKQQLEEEQTNKDQLEERSRLEELAKKQREEELSRQTETKRQIKDALNQQTYGQFRAYAEQQYPGNPEQQAVLIRQLQDQHYQQYMQQLYHQQIQQQQTAAEQASSPTAAGEGSGTAPDSTASPTPAQKEPGEAEALLETSGGEEEEEEDRGEEQGEGSEERDSAEDEDYPEIAAASMWTRKDIREFKEAIRSEGGDAVIRVGHGETVTIRVPTHEDGSCLFWEFATDSYDIGFGVFFEWGVSEDSQVTIHISESEDEDEDPDNPDDPERGGQATGDSTQPLTSCIIPVYRRDCHEEVYAGSHVYPGQGVYQLKFDNSYSLWRSKTLYYRVYYTR